MTPLSPDTDPTVERVWLELLRQAPAWRKLHMLDEMNQAVRELALAGLRQRHPHDSSARLLRRLADILSGEELAMRAYGPLPPMN